MNINIKALLASLKSLGFLFWVMASHLVLFVVLGMIGLTANDVMFIVGLVSLVLTPVPMALGAIIANNQFLAKLTASGRTNIS